MQMESDAPSPALGHRPGRENVSAAVRETGTVGKWHRAGGPSALACGRRVEHVLAPPWLDHRFELITLAQVESGGPSRALGHLLVRETVSATARETGTVGEWQRSP